jgi:hypothetical protein
MENEAVRSGLRLDIPWHQIDDPQHRQGIQMELNRELSPAHPLWGTDPRVFGRHQGNDDVLVALDDGRFAIVHLVWHGKVDQQPEKFPWTVISENVLEFQKQLDIEVEDWA